MSRSLPMRVTELKGHTDLVMCACFSRDGRLALSASRDDTLRLWRVRNGAVMHVLKGHTDTVQTCCFSPDGRRALSGSDDGTLRVWDVASGALLHVLEGHASDIRSCCFSPDGRRALSSSVDDTLRLWDVGTGANLHTLREVDAVSHFSFSADGSTVLAASNSTPTRYVWRPDDGTAVIEHDGADTVSADVYCFSPDGSRVLVEHLEFDETVLIRNSYTGDVVCSLEGHAIWVSSGSFSADGRQVLTGSIDTTLRLWDASSGACVRVLETNQEYGFVHACCISPDGRFAASLSNPWLFLMWDLETGTVVHSAESQAKWCCFSPGGCNLLLYGNSRTIALWTVATVEVLLATWSAFRARRSEGSKSWQLTVLKRLGRPALAELLLQLYGT